MFNLDAVFKPKSIAIVGASTKIGSVGDYLTRNLLKDFKGKIYPVNPKVSELHGLKCYPSLKKIKAPVDLMVIAIPAVFVPAVLKEGGILGIKGAIIISAGFKEVGNSALEKEITGICRKYNIALIGPNCLGVINPNFKLNASFASFSPQAGNLAFISQSGALGSAILDSATNMGLGFSKFISIGNKAVLDESDILSYLEKDKNTTVIGMYAEQLTNPEKLLSQVKSMSHHQKPLPIIILKSGKTSAGAGASASHTGALAGNDAAYAALFRQAGIIRANTVEELFDYIKIFSNNQIKTAKRLAIITNAGGPGVLAVDTAVENNLVIAKLNQKTQRILSKTLPAAASLNNPVDVLGDAKADRFKYALEAVLADSGVDSLLVILTPQSMTEIKETAAVIATARNKSKKPLAVAFMGQELVSPGLEILKKQGIATYSYPEAAVKSLAALHRFYLKIKEASDKITVFKNVNRLKVSKIFAQARKASFSALLEDQAMDVLSAYGLPVLKAKVVKNKAEAIAFASLIGKEVVLKIVSPDILHKSDVGGVILNVQPEEVGQKFEELVRIIKNKKPKARIEGVLVAEMVKEKGIEMILGSILDPSLGNAIMLGFGGVYVEILKDVIFGLNPLTKKEAERMINSLKASNILNGVRGFKAADKKALTECVLRLAQLVKDFPIIKEADLNPVLVLESGKGVKILDARIII